MCAISSLTSTFAISSSDEFLSVIDCLVCFFLYFLLINLFIWVSLDLHSYIYICFAFDLCFVQLFILSFLRFFSCSFVSYLFDCSSFIPFLIHFITLFVSFAHSFIP